MAEAAIQTIEVDAPPELCFAVAADLATYPEWTPQIRQVDIKELDAQGRPQQVEMVIDAMIRQISVLLTYTYDHPSKISWTAQPNKDLRALTGSYEFLPAGDATRVVYTLMVEPAFAIPGFLRSQAEKQVMGTALRGFRKRVESLAGE